MPLESAEKSFKGDVRTGRGSGIARWSPGPQRNTGFVWVTIELAGAGNELDAETPDGIAKGRTAPIPFVGPRRDVPARALGER